ncbi:MAG: hypothetical protein IT292_11545 [Deltaproteobacteria bacterium]|nr:hypothetical protein [Deltaproteobacteria bacterium]
MPEQAQSKQPVSLTLPKPLETPTLPQANGQDQPSILAATPAPQQSTHLSDPRARALVLERFTNNGVNTGLENSLIQRKLEVEKAKINDAGKGAALETSYQKADEAILNGESTALNGFKSLKNALDGNSPEIAVIKPTADTLCYRNWLSGNVGEIFSLSVLAKNTILVDQGLIDPSVLDANEGYMPWNIGEGVTAKNIITTEVNAMVEKFIGTNPTRLINTKAVTYPELKAEFRDMLGSQINNEKTLEGLGQVITAIREISKENPGALENTDWIRGNYDTLKTATSEKVIGLKMQAAGEAFAQTRQKEHAIIAAALDPKTSPLFDKTGVLLTDDEFKETLNKNDGFKQRVVALFSTDQHGSVIAEKKATAFLAILNETKSSSPFVVDANSFINGATQKDTKVGETYEKYMMAIKDTVSTDLIQTANKVIKKGEVSVGMGTIINWDTIEQKLPELMGEEQAKLIKPAQELIRMSAEYKLAAGDIKEINKLEETYNLTQLFKGEELVSLAYSGNDTILAGLINKRLNGKVGLTDKHGLPNKEMQAILGYYHKQLADLDFNKVNQETDLKNLQEEVNFVTAAPSYKSYAKIRGQFISGKAALEQKIDTRVNDYINKFDKTFDEAKLTAVEVSARIESQLATSIDTVSVDSTSLESYFNKALDKLNIEKNESAPLETAKLELVDTIAHCYMKEEGAFSGSDKTQKLNDLLTNYQTKSGGELIEMLKSVQNDVPELSGIFAEYNKLTDQRALFTSTLLNSFLSHGAGGELFVHKVLYDHPLNPNMPLMDSKGQNISPSWLVLKSMLLVGVNDPALASGFRQYNGSDPNPPTAERMNECIDFQIYRDRTLAIIRTPENDEIIIDWGSKISGDYQDNPYSEVASQYTHLAK